MTRTTIGWAALLVVIGFMFAAPPVLSQSNSSCGGISATAYVNWPQFQYDPCHTGYNPNEIILGPSNVGSLTLAWEYPTPGLFSFAPAVADGIAYVSPAVGDYLYALDAKTGRLLWTFPLIYESDSPAPVVANGVVYLNSTSYLYALRAKDGTLLWSYTNGGWMGVASVVDGVVYVGGSGVYALNADTGALLWTNPDTWGDVAVANGVVYTPDVTGYLHAFNAITGVQLWVTGFYCYAWPVVANGIIYLGTEGGSPYGPGVVALRADTGAFLWYFQTQQPIYNTPAVAYGTVYLASNDNYLYALNAQTGELRWTYPMASAFDSPVVANGVVYAISYECCDGPNYGIQAVNAMTGQLLWQDASATGSSSVANGWLYAADGGNTYAFHLPGH